MANGPFRGVPRGAGILPGTRPIESPSEIPQGRGRVSRELIDQLIGARQGTAAGGDRTPIAATQLGDVAFSGPVSGRTSFPSVEDLIESRVPTGQRIIEQGTREAQRLSELARTEGGAALEPFFDTRALEERNALLGLSGAQAQEQAIGDIPITEFDRMLQDRQRRSLARRQQASGDLGGGSSIAELSQLGAQQQAQAVQQRLNQLAPLVQASRGVGSALSTLDEEELLRQAQLEQASGIQTANIRLGTTAPVLSAIQNRGELAGLRAISQANQRSQMANQLASVIPQGIQAFQNFQTNQAVNQDLNTAFANNPGVF